MIQPKTRNITDSRRGESKRILLLIISQRNRKKHLFNLIFNQEADNKKKQIDKFNNRRMTDKDIHHMLKEKERFMQNPKNYAMYKSKLSKDRDSATTQGNFDEADR